MALTLPTNVRNASCDAVVDLIDIGSTNPGGRLRIGTTGMGATLVEAEFSAPAFGNSATGEATANTVSDGTATGAGTAAEAIIIDRDEANVITGLTVGTGAEDVVLTSLVIAVDDKVEINAGTITMPAS